jgi:hypothetical protein
MPLNLVLLTEDGSEYAPTTIRTLIERILFYLNGNLDPEQVTYDEPSEDSRWMMIANKWRAQTPPLDRRVVAFAREIATAISRANGFVLMHHDGDEPYSRRGTRQKQYDDAFDRLVVRIAQITATSACRRDASEPPRNPLTLDDVRRRLLRVIPYYSIESWLIQNRAVASKVCERHHGTAHRGVIESLSPTDIEDALDPKTSFCVGTGHNAELVRGFPVETVCRAGLSLHESVARLTASTPFNEAVDSCSRRYA